MGIILLIALGAIAAAVLHAVVFLPEMNTLTEGLDPQTADLVRMPATFETCIVFYAALYFLGCRLPLWIGDVRSATLLEVQSIKHQRLLHAFGGALIVGSRYYLRPYYHEPLWKHVLMMIFGALMIVSSFFKPHRDESPGVIKVDPR